MPTSLSNQIIRRRHLGFSIVEIMVGIVISMLAVLVIMQVYTVFEGRKRTATGGSDAQTNGSVALYTMDRDVRLAGYGINLPQALGCKVNALYNDKESHLSPSTKPFTLTPVEVTDGAGGLPDTIRLLYSGKGKFSLPARVITDHPAEADNFFLNTTVGIEPNDLMIAFEPGKDCTLLQVTDIPSGNVQILHSNGKSPWDPPGGLNIFPPGGYSTNAMLFNLGSLIIHSYSLDAGNNLQLANYLSASDTDEILTLFPNIVNL
ncbi:MAG TPA: hypothetical protein VHK70_03170, partial [Burkholderiaceae bacterium]|nr:hypothetical protein [Burkholderiaceae bacterium]